ncbi:MULTISPECIES: cytochrome c1 [Hyphomonas]|uniref:Cytochrome c1 n=1 Tax=Hyphomonas adhaerens TaxID=81029 RepID=A0A3B9H238_9PROT|nr:MULTISPECIES: cytochrome c1 [Hyphomonas]MBB41180.1 cytochrome c1 [Hyphomonas sp.]HAE28762.1 cytochrome c1 [Hyphomonas adhaerens]|tara:strand:- start:15144 stop:16085 length:942 start_codon:yes stop_codon:yes gene_type:complete
MKALRLLTAGLAGLIFTAAAHAAGGAEHPHPPEGGWPFEGPTGQFDQASLQRGYQVYHQVCSSCHSMKLMSYRNLGEPGGPFYDPAYPNPNDNPFVKALAAENEILSPTPNDIGDFDYRPATPADTFRSPYPNVQAARAANGGAAPPDLSVITKARHGGASYVFHLLSGYPDNDAFVKREVDGETANFLDMSKVGGHGGEHGEGFLKINAGQYYNPYMAGDTTPNYEGDPRHPPKGGFLAMPPQLIEGRVEYMDGTEATVEQMAYDVAQFLAWAGEPKQEHRKSLGLAVMAYLLILAVLLWFSYKQIWRKIEH